MICPHCHNTIEDGSNICPLCYANLAGVKVKDTQDPQLDAHEHTVKKSPAKKKAYAKGSRGAKHRADRTPVIIATGLILILIVIIAMIFRSMFSTGGKSPAMGNTAAPQATPTLAANFVVFGQTPTPGAVTVTATPNIEITPSPAPVVSAEISYKTLRKGDQGAEVVTLQQALVELGLLSSAADGNFGTGTENAVKNFQSSRGLAADGIAGKMTLEALFKESSVTPMPETTVGPGDILDLPG